MQADALVVGGGPVGLALAIGLVQKGLKVIVLEKTRSVGKDWSTTYTYRVDARGIACLETLGLREALVSKGIESRGFVGKNWDTDGSITTRSSNASIGLGYWLQRPALISLLESALPEGTVLHAELLQLTFGDARGSSAVIATAEVQSQGPVGITAKLAFGCDGSRSSVRGFLQSLGPEMDAAFEPRVLRTPSTGLVYKAVLYTPPESLEPGKAHVAKGKSGLTIAMLPFAGEPGQPRPLSFAQAPDHVYHSLKTPADVYAKLREEFPQLEADERLPPDSAAAWCESPGSTFPSARWCVKAAHIVGDAGVALLGDALHCFPPDLGQGVNAGLSDVSALLALWPSSGALWTRSLEAYEAAQVPEAEAICRLLPIGFPYQYNMPRSFAKFAFFAEFLVRVASHKLMPRVFSPPVVFMVTTDPPRQYTNILRCHQRNTRRLLQFTAAFAGCMATVVYLRAPKGRR